MIHDLTEVAVFFSIVLAATVTVWATHNLRGGKPRDTYDTGQVRRRGTCSWRTWLPAFYDGTHRQPTDIDRLNPERRTARP